MWVSAPHGSGPHTASPAERRSPSGTETATAAAPGAWNPPGGRGAARGRLAVEGAGSVGAARAAPPPAFLARLYLTSAAGSGMTRSLLVTLHRIRQCRAGEGSPDSPRLPGAPGPRPAAPRSLPPDPQAELLRPRRSAPARGAAPPPARRPLTPRSWRCCRR